MGQVRMVFGLAVFLLAGFGWPASTRLYAQSDTPAQALERAEAKWRERGPRSYAYGVILTCFCSPRGMDFRVVDGRTQLPGKATAATKGLNDAYGTIEALFAKIRRAIEAGGHRVEVKYHEQLGYPIWADLDPNKNVIDDEVFIRVTGFRLLVPGPSSLVPSSKFQVPSSKF